jgi:hypothetical protein
VDIKGLLIGSLPLDFILSPLLSSLCHWGVVLQDNLDRRLGELSVEINRWLIVWENFSAIGACMRFVAFWRLVLGALLA